MPKISIIIATYNSGRTLRAALESVHGQTFQNWECIIVDGASKDDTIDIVKEYCAKDSRFRYISEPDHGIYDAFNKGWRMAKGEWVHYLGSDDTLTPNGMSVVAAELDDTYAIVTGNVYLHRVDGTVKEQQYKIIQNTNAMSDDYHVGIRDVRDIKTFEEAINDRESFVYGDYTKADALRDLGVGQVMVYSSKSIVNGTFVSTSKNMALDYAGNGKVNAMKVKLSDIAWVLVYSKFDHR